MCDQYEGTIKGLIQKGFIRIVEIMFDFFQAPPVSGLTSYIVQCEYKNIAFLTLHSSTIDARGLTEQQERARLLFDLYIL